ncbi:MAG: glycoside hydrolase [Acidimicrobiia bacterium]|nr:glycoside hydrolase [Acidimicrobiia bacterium]
MTPSAPETPGETLAARARAVLEHNRRGAWTCPNPDFYPHQWLWDSCFVAIGLSTFDPQRAADELMALFRGQWSNGMLPHMIFADDVSDVGSERIWQSRKNPLAPRDVATSCITQPPIAAIAAWHIGQDLPADERRGFLAEALPKLVAYHSWLYRERDLQERGLVTLIHPWECGLDTTPPWMRSLRRMSKPWWLRAALKLRLSRVARFFRRDTRYAPAAERLSDDDGLRMLVLAHRAKRYDFELRRMPPKQSVLIEDLAFNSFLIVANRALTQIAGELDVAIDPELEHHFPATVAALDELWDESTGQYYSRNAITGALLEVPTVATFLPLWADVPPDRAARLVGHLADDSGYWPRYPVPSVPTDHRAFDAHRYWKGPTWVNMNWAIIQGLRECGAADVADELRSRTLDLTDQHGVAEYFSSLTGEGIGAENFSWTAALVLDLLDE